MMKNTKSVMEKEKPVQQETKKEYNRTGQTYTLLPTPLTQQTAAATTTATATTTTTTTTDTVTKSESPNGPIVKITSTVSNHDPGRENVSKRTETNPAPPRYSNRK